MVERRNILATLFSPLWFAGVYVFLYLPVVVLVLFSFNSSAVSVSWAGASLRWYRELLVASAMWDALYVSLIVAVCSTLLSVTMGTLLVFAMRSWRPRFFSLLFYPNIILPELILALGLLSLFAFFQIPLGYGSLICGHTLIGLGFAVPILRARFSEINPVFMEASADLGATPFQTLRKVLMPLLSPALVASSLLVFTLSLDDFFIAFFCSGSHIQTLSVYVYSKVREGVDPSINALSACLLAISGVLVLILCSTRVVSQALDHEE